MVVLCQHVPMPGVGPCDIQQNQPSGTCSESGRRSYNHVDGSDDKSAHILDTYPFINYRSVTDLPLLTDLLTDLLTYLLTNLFTDLLTDLLKAPLTYLLTSLITDPCTHRLRQRPAYPLNLKSAHMPTLHT